MRVELWAMGLLLLGIFRGVEKVVKVIGNDSHFPVPILFPRLLQAFQVSGHHNSNGKKLSACVMQSE